MFKLGLKLFSTNEQYIDDALRLYREKFYDYIELYSFPDSYDRTISSWAKLNVPYVIHAPHYTHGINLADKTAYQKNAVLAGEAFQFADKLGADKVIFHTGVGGSIDETIFQIEKLNDSRIIIENKPMVSSDGNLTCTGYTPAEIEKVINETGCGFCLDIDHAVCAANSLKIDSFLFLNKCIALRPVMYHLSDGDFCSPYDTHLHFGDGNYPISEILSMIPDGSLITDESVKKSQYNLNDLESEFLLMKNIYP